MSNGSSPSNVLGTILKLVVASLVVGDVISVFEITPEAVLENFGETVHAVYSWALGVIDWAGTYVITGALLVIPIWAIAAGLNYLQRRGRK